MNKIKTKSFILLSSFFFFPSLSGKIDSPIFLSPNINPQKEIVISTWKPPISTINTSITYKALTQEEIEFYYPKIDTNPIPSNSELDNWFSTYANQYNISYETLKKIAWCESHYNPNAINGIYGGMFQYSSSTWISTRNMMGLDSNPDLRFNPEESIKTSAFKISVGGIGAWPNCNR